MLATKIIQKFPFISNYFSLLLESNTKKFPQSIVFEGLDVYAQCFFALELARVLNCLEAGDENCQCLNCRWIREGKHPAVNFVSQLHFKEQNDDSKTVISVAQVKNIEKSLREKSDYHRFFIFFDAKQTPLDDAKRLLLNNYSPEGYDICPDENWTMGHLNQKTFSPLTLNILLKCVEEPPERTTFVFLTKNRSDLINTIVSRSQCFKLPVAVQKVDFAQINSFFENYPNITLQEAFLISENLQNYIKENEISADCVLDSILAYFLYKLKHAFDNQNYSKLQNDIKYVSEAKMHLASSILEKTVFDTLLLKFAGSVK